jgi:hypothetical protein
MWAALAFISLALVLLGVLVWRRPLPTAERVAQPPAVPTPAARGASDGRARAPVQAARETPARDIVPAGERAPSGNATPPEGSGGASSGAKAAPRSPQATQREVVRKEAARATRARAERPRSAKPAAPKPSPARPSPPPGPFKNPFE